MHKIMINHTHPRDNKRPGYSAVKNFWTRNGPETDHKDDHGTMAEISSNGTETFYESNCVLCS